MESPHTTQPSRSVIPRTVILNFTYLPSPWERRVEEVCSYWVGTPYRLNMCHPGEGVDCIHYGAAVLDRLYGTEHSKNLQSLPPDACVHNRKGVEKATRALLKSYPAMKRVEDGTIEAGDLVITGPVGEHPTASHLLIAGKRAKLWQASKGGVNFTGYGILDCEMLVAVYRAGDKDKWLTC